MFHFLLIFVCFPRRPVLKSCVEPVYLSVSLSINLSHVIILVTCHVSFVIVYYNFSLFFPLLFSRFLFALRLCLCLSSPSHSFPPFLSISLHSSPRLLPSFFFFLLRHPLFFLFPLSPSFTPSLLPLPFLSHCRRSHSLSPSLFPSLIV